MSDAGLLRAIGEAELGSWAEWAARYALPSLRLAPDEAPISRDSSHLGGSPLMPATAEWPYWKGRPQSCIAQIRLSDLGEHALGFGLPGSGFLTFFYDSEQGTWGFDPADAGSFLVAWYPEDATLEIRPPPDELDAGSRFARVPVAFRRQWTIPQYGSIEIQIGPRGEAVPTGPTGEEIDFDSLGRLDELLAGPADVPRHRMFGYADQIQNEMRTECELVTNGIYTGDASFAGHPRRAELERNGHLWRLLLQVDSDDRLGTMWGDAGRVYYWIRQDALRERDFDRAWFSLQCS